MGVVVSYLLVPVTGGGNYDDHIFIKKHDLKMFENN